MQQKYWDKLAPSKTFTTTLDVALIQSMITRDAKIVDYGCGYGRTLDELFRLGYHNLAGFDFSEAMIKRGHEAFPYLKLKVARNDLMSCPSASVDLVLLFALLTCVIDDKQQQQIIGEAWRVLKPGGYVYINDFLLNTDDRNISRYKKYVRKYNTYGVFELDDGGVLRHHDEAYLQELLSGFKQELLKKTVFTTMNGHLSNGFVMLAKKVNNE